MIKNNIKSFACLFACLLIFNACKKEEKQQSSSIIETGKGPHYTDSFIFHSNTRMQSAIWIKDLGGNVMTLKEYKIKYLDNAKTLAYCGTGQELDNTFLYYRGFYMSILSPQTSNNPTGTVGLEWELALPDDIHPVINSPQSYGQLLPGIYGWQSSPAGNTYRNAIL